MPFSLLLTKSLVPSGSFRKAEPKKEVLLHRQSLMSHTVYDYNCKVFGLTIEHRNLVGRSIGSAGHIGMLSTREYIIEKGKEPAC